MPWPDKYYGIIENPLLVSPFIANNDIEGMGPISNDFLLLDGQNFLLLDGQQFDLLGS